MTNTTYYDLNIVEGGDIVNPLIVDNPNYEIIDKTMHDNAVSGVTLATEIANATVHAITRENSECAVIRFIATSEWKAGDTVTVDGVPVTALLPSGETLPDGAYVINANVLCILTGTLLTVFAERKKTDNANEIKYNDTNVGEELDKVNSNLDVTSGSVDISNVSVKHSGTILFLTFGRLSIININLVIGEAIPTGQNTEVLALTGAKPLTQCDFVLVTPQGNSYCCYLDPNGKLIIANYNSTLEAGRRLYGQCVYIKQ